ncbi:hypothetical protein [Streptomyces nitrosporeus]|uniref:hypothetical protein n=1 Tax=Streptomyces nitrosporeus TaxID=28894 RepID=UPI00331E1C74
MRTARRWTAAFVLIPALAATAACGGSETKEQDTGKAVYGLPLQEQFNAATEATRGTGTAAFTSTLTYTSRGGKAVERTEGSLDFDKGTARAAVTLKVDRGFDKGGAELVGEPGSTAGRTLSTRGDDVYVRQDSSPWLRYTPEAITRLGVPTRAVSAHTAGDVAPYSGTLADLVPRMIPRTAPEQDEAGGRLYRVTTLPETAAELLPPELQVTQGDEVEVTVRLDPAGRLSEVTADLSPLLVTLSKDDDRAEGITSLEAAYTIGSYGEPVSGHEPDGDVQDAAEVLTPIGDMKRGRCAASDTGLGGFAVVRPVDCAKKHTVRVLGQTEVKETFPMRAEYSDPDVYGQEQCRRIHAEAPDAWVREAAVPGRLKVFGYGTVDQTFGGEVTGTVVSGDYTCFLTTS